MSRVTDLDALIERVTAAQAAARELDLAIGAALGLPDWYREEGEFWLDPPVHREFETIPGEPYPNLTGSVDDASALAEKALPGWDWYVRRYAGSRRGYAWVSAPGDDTGYAETWGATPALALVLATLKALGDTP
jgi:hypothetical protein